jgi:hypothetical protein
MPHRRLVLVLAIALASAGCSVSLRLAPRPRADAIALADDVVRPVSGVRSLEAATCEPACGDVAETRVQSRASRRRWIWISLAPVVIVVAILAS